MADEQAQVETTEEQVEEQVSETETEASGGETPTGDGEDMAAKMARMEAALRKANAEAADRRIKLQEFEEAEKKRQEAELSETERLKKQLDEAKAERERLLANMQETQMRSAVERAAATMRFHDPADAYALADLSSVTVEDGKVNGVDAALKALAKAKPHLVRQEQPANLNANNRTNGAQAMTDDEAQRMAAIYGVRPESIKKVSK
jgi:hypothetical protein